jgi:hypothetical protein
VTRADVVFGTHKVAAIETTLAAAAQKLETMRGPTANVHLGMPDIRRSAGRSSSNC